MKTRIPQCLEGTSFHSYRRLPDILWGKMKDTHAENVLSVTFITIDKVILETDDCVFPDYYLHPKIQTELLNYFHALGNHCFYKLILKHDLS